MSSSLPPVAVTSTSMADGVLPPGGDGAIFGRADASATGVKWTALHEAAGVVAILAGLEEERPSAEIRAFPTAIRDAAPWRREAAETAIADLAAIMEPGIAALLAVNARGTDTQAPALALWQEFRTARAAVLALAPLPFAPEPHRTS